MLGSAFVRPLDEPWRDVLEAVGRSRGWPTSRDVPRLAARVAELSAAYNDPRRARATVREAGPARLAFSFPRDVPKGAAAVRELLAVGALPLHGPLRVLDVGAGLGAMTWGLARAREAAGGQGEIDATWVDADAEALGLGLAIAAARPARTALRVRTVRASLDGVVGAVRGLPAFDVVVLGQVLSEVDVGAEPGHRAAKHAAALRALMDECLAGHGSLVIIEPALRDRTRHLHRVRDAAVQGGATVFAPCLHAQSCPALAREGDWCHEDLPVDLPPWLTPVARAAGLRHEGLTYSYLVLRRDKTTLTGALGAPPGAGLLRVVSERIKTKGKLEMFLCGSFRGPPEAFASPRARVARLDRDGAGPNRAWQELERGDVAVVSPAPEAERPRIGAATSVSVAVPAESD